MIPKNPRCLSPSDWKALKEIMEREYWNLKRYALYLLDLVPRDDP